MTRAELHNDANLFREGDLPQGPLLAVRHFLGELGWNLPQAHTITTTDGDELDLTLGSPAMLRYYIGKRYGEIHNEEAEAVRTRKGRLTTGQSLGWMALR